MFAIGDVLYELCNLGVEIDREIKLCIWVVEFSSFSSGEIMLFFHDLSCLVLLRFMTLGFSH